MPITIIKYVALALAGLVGGQMISDSLGTDAPAYYPEPSILTPFMLLSCAILLIAIVYCIKNVIISVRSCMNERERNHNPTDYYQ